MNGIRISKEPYSFINEKDQCLQSLKELFLLRIRERKERRIRQNKDTVYCIREVPVKIWITNIMAYLDLDDAFKMGQVCVYFNQIIKSPLFIKYFVTLKEKTKVDVSLSHLDL